MASRSSWTVHSFSSLDGPNGVTFSSHLLIYAVELTHLVVKWSAVRNQSEIETSLKMRGMSPFLFVKLVQQRRTQNHAKPAHRVRRSSGQPFTGTTRSAGLGGFGLALAILVAVFLSGHGITARSTTTRPTTSLLLYYSRAQLITLVHERAHHHT